MRSNQISKKGHLLFSLAIANLWFPHTSFCRISFVIKLTASHCCVLNIQYAFGAYILYLYNINIKNMHTCLRMCTVDVLNYSFMLLVMCDSLFFLRIPTSRCLNFNVGPCRLTHTHAHNFSRSQGKNQTRIALQHSKRCVGRFCDNNSIRTVHKRNKYASSMLYWRLDTFR